MTERKLFRAAVYMLIKKEGKFLALRRFNTGYRDGEYTFPAGHVDDGESAIHAAVRELKEEVNLEAQEEDTKLVHVMQHKEGNHEYFDFYFEITKWNGEPKICEEDKMDDLRFISSQELDELAIPGFKKALEEIEKQNTFSSLIVR